MKERNPQSKKPAERSSIEDVLVKYKMVIDSNVSDLTTCIIANPDSTRIIPDDLSTQRQHKRVQYLHVNIHYNNQTGRISDRNSIDQHSLFNTMLEMTTITVGGNSFLSAKNKYQFYKLLTVDSRGQTISPQRVYKMGENILSGPGDLNEMDRVVLFSFEQFNRQFGRRRDLLEDFFSKVIETNKGVSVEVVRTSFWQTIRTKLRKLFDGDN